MNKELEALEQAKKEHELLELYREYHIVLENSEFYKRLYTSLLESNRDYHDDYLSYKRCEEDKDKIIERIIKLEDELKEKNKMNENIDYKALYEEAQAKLDKIAHDELKQRLDDTLRIKHNKMYGYDREDQLKRVQENMSLEFMCRLDRDEVQTFIDEIGYDKLWSIIKELYQEEEEEE